MVYMDTTAMTTRTTTRPTTVAVTTTTSRTTTTKMPATTTALAQWPRTTSTVGAPAPMPVDGVVPDDDDDDVRAPASSKLPNIRVEFCNPLVMMDISWPKTKQGVVAKMPCPPGTTGNADFCNVKYLKGNSGSYLVSF